MSIIFGYDYFDTTAEDRAEQLEKHGELKANLNTLEEKIKHVEKKQQSNSAEIVAHTKIILVEVCSGMISVKFQTIPPETCKQITLQKPIKTMQSL
jgi:hypothetical protein